MRRVGVIVLALVPGYVEPAQLDAQAQQNYHSLLDSNQIFALRAAITHRQTPPFYLGRCCCRILIWYGRRSLLHDDRDCWRAIRAGR